MSTERETLQELLTEAHQVMRDLRGLIREAKEAREAITEAVTQASIRQAVDEVLAAEVNRGMEKFGEELTTAIKTTEAAIYERFDLLSKTLMGETKEARRKYGQTLPEAIAAEAEARERVRLIMDERGFQ